MKERKVNADTIEKKEKNTRENILKEKIHLCKSQK